MANVNFTVLNGYLENRLINFYIHSVKDNPQPEGVSKSLYLTMLTLQVLEKLGNTHPTQIEIDRMELILSRISKRKSVQKAMLEMEFNNRIPSEKLTSGMVYMPEKTNLVSANKESEKRLKQFYFGDSLPDIYFTDQERRCMFYCLKGLTDKQIGLEMNLSQNTISSYLMNMKRKLNCTSKKNLIAIMQTPYYKAIK